MHFLSSPKGTIPILALLISFGMGTRGAASVANADFQSYLAAHHYVQVPLSDAGTNEQQIEAMINGQRVRLIVDTGFSRTALSYECGRRLHLKVIDSGRKVTGVGGKLEENNGVALTQSFIVGGFQINRTNIIDVLPRSANCQADGYFGLDFLKLNASILLVGSRGMILKPGATPTVPLNNYMRGLGFTAIPLFYKSGALGVNGQLNGTAFKAVVDTGDSFTMFDERLVQAASDRALSSSRWSMEGIDGTHLNCCIFTPKTLNLGGLDILPLKLIASTSTMLSKAGMNAFLGFDLMALHAGVIDLGSDTLWMK